MKHERAVALGMGLAVSIFWGLSFLSIKVTVAVLPPMTLGFARFAIALAILPLVALAMGERLRVKARDHLMLALGGLVGVTLYFLCENNGVLLLSASESSIVIGVIPVATMIADRLFLKTRLSARSWIGAVLSFAGVGLIAMRAPGAGSSPLGFLYMAGAALSWVAYSFATRAISARYGRITVTFWQSFWGFLGFIPFVLAERPRIEAMSTSVVLNLLFLGVFCTALGYWFYVTSLDVLGASATSTWINLIPVVSVVAAFFILGERLGALQLAGGAAAIAGVWLATTAPAPADKAPAAQG